MNQSTRVRIFLTTYRYQIMTVAALLLLCGLGGWLRFHQIGQTSLWLDEAYTYLQAKGSLAEALQSDPNMSLFWFLAHFWEQIFPHASEATLRTLPAIFSLAGIPAVFLLGKTLVPDEKKATAIGFVAALMITLNAFQIEYAQEYRSYSLYFLNATLSTFFLIKMVEDPDGKLRWLIGYVLATAATFYSHFYSVLIILAQALSMPVLLLGRKRTAVPVKRLLYCAVGVGILILPIGIVALQKGPDQIAWIPHPSWSDVNQLLRDFTGAYRSIKMAFLILFLAGLGAYYGLTFGTRNGRDRAAWWRVTLLLSCLFVPVIASLTISMLVRPIFVSKYLFPVIAYVAVLAAAGLEALASIGGKRRLLRVVFTAFGVVILGWCIYHYIPGIKSVYGYSWKPDSRTAARILTEKCSDSLRLYYKPGVENAPRYYNPSLQSQVGQWWYGTLKSKADAEEIAGKLPDGYDQVCLTVMSNDEQKLVVLEAIQMKYPVQGETFEFKGGEIRIFRRP